MMKKLFCLAILSFSLNLGVFAITPGHNSTQRKNTISFERIGQDKKIEINGHQFALLNYDKMRSRRAAAPMKSPVLYEVEGTLKEYSKQSGGYVYYGMIRPYQDYGQSAQIVWNDEELYFYNILSYSETDSYVAAEKVDDEILLEMNQTVVSLDGFDVILGLLKTELYIGPNPDWEEGDDEDTKEIIFIDFVYSNEYDYVTYSLDENGSLELVLPEETEFTPGEPIDDFIPVNPSDYDCPPFILGLYYSDDHSWTGDGDLYQIYDEFNYELVEFPDNLTPETYSYVNSDGSGVLVDVARSDDKLYFRGLSPYLPEAVFAANIVESENGLTAEIPQYQYIGKTSDGYYNILTRALVFDPETQGYVEAPSDICATLSIQQDSNGVISAFLTEEIDNVLTFNYDSGFFDSYEEFYDLKLTKQESTEGVPADPEISYADDYSSWMGANFLFFYISPIATDGSVLDANNLYYRIYLNDEPFIFEQKDGEDLKGDFVTMYEGITEPTDLIPFYFYNGKDLWYDAEHLYYVGFYIPFEEIKTLGVQAVYLSGGEKTESNVISIDLNAEDDGVKEMEATELSSDYFDFNGIKVINPDKGFFIKKSVMSDGKVKTMKVVR